MNTLQKIVVVFGLAGLALTGLFPPWASLCNAGSRTVFKRDITYSLLFDPPRGMPGHCEVSLDISVLLTVWVVVLAITFGLALLFGLKKQEPNP